MDSLRDKVAKLLDEDTKYGFTAFDGETIDCVTAAVDGVHQAIIPQVVITLPDGGTVKAKCIYDPEGDAYMELTRELKRKKKG